MDPRDDQHPLIGAGYKTFETDTHSSGITDYFACPRRFMLSEMFHLRPKGWYDSALATGTSYHLILASLLAGNTAEAAIYQANEVTTRLLEHLEASSDEMGLLPNGKAQQEMAMDMRADADKAIAMASWSWRAYPLELETERFPEGVEVIAVEEPIRVKFAELKAWQRGTMDIMIRDKATGDLWIVDHKTTGFSPQVISQTYMFAVQPRVYRRLAEARYGHLGKVVGIVHNVIAKPSIRHKKNQTWEDYLVEVGEWYSATKRHKDKTSKWALDPPFIRSFVTFDQTEAGKNDEELDVQIEEVDRASRSYPKLALFPRREASCIQFNKLCRFIDICQSDPMKWGEILRVRFEVGHRDDDQETKEIDLTI